MDRRAGHEKRKDVYKRQGYSRAAEGFIDRVQQNQEWGYQVKGILDDHKEWGTEYKSIHVLSLIHI